MINIKYILHHMTEDFKFVKRSKYRRNALKTLAKGPEIPFRLARKSDIPPTHISSTLRDLKEHGIVRCINPEDSKGRIYILTERGEKVVNSDEFKKLMN